jgi:hypothetical protein
MTTQTRKETSQMIAVEHSDFFRFTCLLLKHFGYGLLGFGIAIVLFGTFGFGHIAALILTLIGPWLARSAIVLGCMFVAAVVVESLRH